MSKEPDITFILEKDDDGKFNLWVCRGKGKGCKRNTHRSKSKHCDDCIFANDMEETLEELQKRLRRGDA